MAELKRHMDVLERVSEIPIRQLPPQIQEPRFLYLANSRRATIARCTSSGPSANRNTRA